MKKLIVMATMLSGVLFLTGCGETKVSLANYCDVTYSGLNGKASASCDMRLEDLEETLAEGKDENELLTMLLEIEDSIDVNLNKTENIENGDKLVATISCDQDIASKYDFKFEDLEKEVEVKGLSDGTTVDLFQDVTLEYEGVAPEATVTVCNNSQDDAFLKTVNYSVDNNTNLANGDKVIVTASYDEEKAIKYEYIVDEVEKEYTVEGIDEYLTEYKQIDSDTLEKMEEQSIDLIESELAKKYSYTGIMYPDEFKLSVDMDKVKVNSIELEKAYFFTLKPGMEKGWSDVSNSIFLIYKVETVDEDSPKGVIAYIPIYYKDFILRDTGTIDVVITDASMPDTYSNMENLYREVVTANKSKYEFEEIKY